MQTFLPYPDYKQAAACLDNKRLGKQRVECLQILNAITNPNYGWQNHPAVKMWRSYEDQLLQYTEAICQEWVNIRGFKDTCWSKFQIQYYLFVPKAKQPTSRIPRWLGVKDFHASHRSNLLRKDPIYYGQFNWTEPHDLPYVWPVGE